MNCVSVCWIHHKNHTDIFSQGYIGVSKQLSKRIRKHFQSAKNSRHENKLLENSMLKYKDDVVFSEVVRGSEEYCYDIENKIRPSKNIGWNLAEGGSCPPPTAEQIEKRRISTARPWIVVSPDGNKYEIRNLRLFCTDNGLDHSSMYRVAKGERRHHKQWTVAKDKNHE